MTARPDFEHATPKQLYEQVQAMDDGEFEALMDDPECTRAGARGDHRRARRPLPAGEGEGGRGSHSHQALDAPGGGYDHYELVIADQQCRLTTPPTDEPDLTLKVRPTDLRKLINGDTGPKRLAFQGRLRAIGDLGLGMKLPDLFAI